MERIKIPGKFKSEIGEKNITEFVGLKPNMYSFLIAGDESKKSKGIQKAVVKNKMNFWDFKTCLFSGEKQTRSMNLIRSQKHDPWIISESFWKIRFPPKHLDMQFNFSFPREMKTKHFNFHSSKRALFSHMLSKLKNSDFFHFSKMSGFIFWEMKTKQFNFHFCSF